MIDTCLHAGVVPNVTINHFTIPRWLDRHGSWPWPDAGDRFARFTEFVRPILRPKCRTSARSTSRTSPPALPTSASVKRYRRRACHRRTRQFSDALAAAHHRAVEIVRSRGGPKVGWAVATQVFQPHPGAEELAAEHAYPRETRFLEEARGNDWLGEQAYTRTRVGPDGPLSVQKEAETTLMGFGFLPRGGR